MRQWKKRAGAMLLSMAMVLGPAAVAAGAEKTITVTPMTLNINGQDVTPHQVQRGPGGGVRLRRATYVPPALPQRAAGDPGGVGPHRPPTPPSW